MSESPDAASGFALWVGVSANQVVVGVSGELDVATAPDLERLVGALIERGHTEVVLDLADLGFLDSSGLEVVAHLSARLRRRGAVLKARGLSERTRRILTLSAMGGLVEVEPPDPAALPPRSEQPTSSDPTTADAAPADRAVWLARVTALPAEGDAIDAALELVTALVHATVAGADGVSVSVPRHGRLTTVAATDETIAQMDRDQYATGQGPCLAAADEGHRFHIDSLAEEVRWPDFVPRALDGGIGSILSTPLLAAAGPVGALNIYSRTARAFGPPEMSLAALFATQASRIVAGAGVDGTSEAAANRLQDALRRREVIAQAQGVLMARHNVSAEAAYASLRRSSTRADIPLRDQATATVASTQLPAPSTGSTP